jgi:hypothetical protein
MGLLIMKIIAVVFCIYILIVLLAYFFQDRLLFFPHKIHHDFNYQLTANDTEFFLKTSDRETINCIYATLPQNKNVVLYFHGNGSSLNSWKEVANDMLPQGANLLMIDYRGYGKSTGTFSEKGFYIDAETAYQFLKSKGYKDENIFFYGRSLGSGIAVEMAMQHQVKGLILESPYTSVIDVAKSHRPYLLPGLILKYHFNSLAKAEKINSPVLIFHGVKDPTIPVSQSKILAAAIKTEKQLVIFDEGNHANLSSFEDYKKALHVFLNR